MEKESKPKIKTTKTVIIVVAAVLGVQVLLFAAYLIISSLSGNADSGMIVK